MIFFQTIQCLHCRFGLNSEFRNCPHVSEAQLESAAKILAENALSDIEISVLEIRVDNPTFWGLMYKTNPKKLFQEVFVRTARSQLFRLSGTLLGQVERELFLNHAAQLIQISRDTKNPSLFADVQYFTSNLRRKVDYDFIRENAF